MKRLVLKVIAALGVITLAPSAAACGGGGTRAPTTNRLPRPASTVGASCSPSGMHLHVGADDLKFLDTCLAVPGNTAFTILFDNRDALFVHNVAIYTADRFTNPDAKQLFKGPFVTGPGAITYHVGALPPGTYRFQCDAHPFTMNGTLIVS